MENEKQLIQQIKNLDKTLGYGSKEITEKKMQAVQSTYYQANDCFI